MTNYIPINANPFGGVAPISINPYDKNSRCVGMSVTENRDFMSICKLGSAQLLNCYGNIDRDFTRFDFYNLCSACPYSLNNFRCSDGFVGNTHPRFVELMAKDLSIKIDEDNPKSFVYFITNGEFVKIGIADNVKGRLSELQVGSPCELTVICAIPLRSKASARRLERALHNEYRSFHIRGEWFDIFKYIDVEAFSKWFEYDRKEENE